MGMMRIRSFSLILLILFTATIATMGCSGELPTVPSGQKEGDAEATSTRPRQDGQEQQEGAARVVSFPQHQDPLITDRGWGYLLGQLESTNGCLRVRPAPHVNTLIGDPDSYLMVWPANFSVTNERGDIRVIDESGTITARVGDTLRVSGGRWPKEGLPEEVLKSIPEECREYGYYWKVGDEVSALGPGEPATVSIPGSTLHFPRSRTRVDSGGGYGVALNVARIEGELVLDGDCLRVGDSEGPIIVWPPGFTPHIENGVVEIHNGAGKTIARTGDYLVLGGGESGKGEGNGSSPPCTGVYWDDTDFGSITRNGKKVWDKYSRAKTAPRSEVCLFC